MIKHPGNISNHFSKETSDQRFLSEYDLKILWVARTLTNIELQCEAELTRLEKSQADEEQRQFMKGQVLSKFRQRREPYETLLAELRRRHGRSFAA